MGPDSQPTQRSQSNGITDAEIKPADPEKVENGQNAGNTSAGHQDVYEAILEGGDTASLGASEETALDLLEVLRDMEESLERLDLDALELMGLGADQFRQIEEKLGSVIGRLEKHGLEALDRAGAKWANTKSAVPTWVYEIGSFSDSDKTYEVRWDVAYYEENYAGEDEVVDEPEYSCTCKSYIFNNDSNAYCKHVRRVIDTCGDGGNMPDGAKQIGEYVDVNR